MGIRPSLLRAAALTAWVVVVLVVLRTVLVFTRADDLLDARSEEWSGEWAEDRTPLLTGVALGMLAAAAVLGLAAVFLPRGARWARVVAMLFAVVVVAGAEVLAWTPTLGPLLLIDVALMVLCIAVVMLLNPDQVRRRFGR